jgi:hypothetical protein
LIRINFCCISSGHNYLIIRTAARLGVVDLASSVGNAKCLLSSKV